MTTEQNVGSRLGDYLQVVLEERGMTIRDLAIQSEITYEHARKIVRGDIVPSKQMVRIFSYTLGLPLPEMEELAIADRIIKKHGGLPASLVGKKPDMEPLERHWDLLTPAQKSDLINWAKQWAQRNRQSMVHSQ